MRSSRFSRYYNFSRYLINDITRCLYIRKLGIGFKKIPKSILIANFHGIGNMVLFTPVLQTLRAAFPDTKLIVILANRGTKDVISDSGLVNEIIEYDIGDDDWSIFHQIIRYLRGMNIDLGFSCSQNSIESLFLYESNTRYRIGFVYNIRSFKGAKFLLHSAIDHDHARHEVMQNLDLLKPVGINEFIIKPTFYFRQKHLESAYKKLKSNGIFLSNSLIGFHAGSHYNLVEKRWPFEYFADVADALTVRYNSQAVFVGDKNEKADINNIVSMMDQPAVNLAGLLSLKETAAVISTMTLFVSNDSGPMHIAAGVGTPVIGIFGPTREVKNSPWPQDDVPANVIRYQMDCAPCYVSYSGGIHCQTLDCLKKLTPDMVLQACQDTMEEKGHT